MSRFPPELSLPMSFWGPVRSRPLPDPKHRIDRPGRRRRVSRRQMCSAGLVTAKTSLAFHSWSVDTGPLVESNTDIWNEIATSLAKGKVRTAAHGLRYHLEYVSRLLADHLGARPVFRADGAYELGDLLSSVLTRAKCLYGKAADAAQSWGDNAAKQTAAGRKAGLSGASGARNVEQWAINKAVHYNEWENFGKRDFEPVVVASRSYSKNCAARAAGRGCT